MKNDVIKNVKVGDRFTVNAKNNGFEYGVVVESLGEELNITNDESRFIRCKYVSGESNYKTIWLWQKTVELKRYRGKIK